MLLLLLMLFCCNIIMRSEEQFVNFKLLSVFEKKKTLKVYFHVFCFEIPFLFSFNVRFFVEKIRNTLEIFSCRISCHICVPAWDEARKIFSDNPELESWDRIILSTDDFWAATDHSTDRRSSDPGSSAMKKNLEFSKFCDVTGCVISKNCREAYNQTSIPSMSKSPIQKV